MIRQKKHLAYELKVRSSEIDSICQRIPAFYREKKILKRISGSGVPIYRVINPSQKRLKVIQTRIHRNILRKLPLGDYAYGAVPGRDNVDNAERHKGKKFKLTTDLKNFFPSVGNAEVYRMFIQNGFSPTVSRILTRLTTYKGRIPQGAPTSSSIANLVFKKTGDRLEEYAKLNNLTFTTFVDDLFFSSSIDFKEKVPEILGIILRSHQIHHQKTFYSRSPNVTGLHPMNNYLRLPDSFIEKINTMEERSPEEQQGLLLYKYKVDEKNKMKKKKKRSSSPRPQGENFGKIAL